jgi:GNAT superfamily N-acetyltransferase
MSRTAIAYRRAAPQDMPALRSLHRASLGALGSMHYSPRQIAGLFMTSESVDPALIDAGAYFVAESAGRIVGSGGWTMGRPPYETRIAQAGAGGRADAATIRALFVAPERARRGIARAIMDIVETDAVLRGGAIRFELVATLPAVDFYGALGYQPGPRVEIRLVNGGAFPAQRMAKQVLPEGSLALAA